MSQKKKIHEIKHPDYASNATKFAKWRATYNGGDNFISTYLKRFTTREDNADFVRRQEMTYCPAHAKSAIIDIKNAIFQRMADIVRINGTPSYMTAVAGQNGGVTKKSDTMTSFIGNEIIPELLVMAKVGVYIDNGQIPDNASIHDTKDISPYIYSYPREQILSWATSQSGILTSLLLRDFTYSENEFGLVDKQQTFYRLFNVVENGVRFRMYDDKGEELKEKETLLTIPRIPFVIASLGQSLLADVCNYQIALLNIESSDLNFILKANFPFYVEQYDSRIDTLMNVFKTAAAAAAVEDIGENTTEADEATAKSEDRENVKVGATQGRRYHKDLDAPSFIHPSPEPLDASMKKQESIKNDIRRLVNLALSNIAKRDGSAESKKYDERGLEAGLSYIGLVLEKFEREIAIHWETYEGAKPTTLVNYPKKYDLKSDKEKREEAKDLKDILRDVPSLSFQKDLTIEITQIMMRDKVSMERLEVYNNEIEKATVVITDPDVIHKDHEAGLVGSEMASNLRGYPAGEVEKAKVDHAERIARIKIAQTAGTGEEARGNPDGEVIPGSAKNEKIETE